MTKSNKLQLCTVYLTHCLSASESFQWHLILSLRSTKKLERSEVSTITLLDVIVLTDTISKKFGRKNKKINNNLEK